MHRTTIKIPPEPNRKANEQKRALTKAQRRSDREDSLLSDRATFKGKMRGDLAANHDSELYAENSR